MRMRKRIVVTAAMAAGIAVAAGAVTLRPAPARAQGTTYYLVETPNQTTYGGHVGTATALCHAGDTATGGGGEINWGVHPRTLAGAHLVLLETYPYNSSGLSMGWSVSYRNTDSNTSEFEEWNGYAICAASG